MRPPKEEPAGMGSEIERKYLVTGDGWRNAGPGVRYVQGYLSREAERVVRIRRAGDKAYITIKGETRGVTRAEYEYPIPLDDADELLTLCVRPLIDKRRTVVEYGGRKWEVDEFHGDNAGLVMAEVELPGEDEKIELPPWVGREVSDDPRYYNSNLSKHPYREWSGEP